MLKEYKVKGNEGLCEQIGRKLESEPGGQSQAGGWEQAGLGEGGWGQRGAAPRAAGSKGGSPTEPHPASAVA